MSVTAVIVGGEVTENDIIGAFNEEEECVGLSYSTIIPFGPYIGQQAFLIQIYSNTFSYGETISFKFYDQETETTFLIENSIAFVQDSVFGSVVAPLLFYLSSNNLPIAYNGTYSLDEDTMTAITLSASDADGDALTYIVVSLTDNGILTETIYGYSGDQVNGYIPNINFNGTDSFQFKVNDGQEDSNVATITLVVNAINDAPYLYSIDNDEIFLGETFTYNLQAEDAEGDALIYTVSVTGGSATANIDGNLLTISPEESNVTLNVVVTVSDGNATHSISFLLTVLQEQTTCLDNNGDGWCDHFPTITITNGSAQVLIQNSLDEYTDSGASCSDQEDGNITFGVEVSGAVVNISNPGTYILFYNCSDSDGNVAQTQHRTVFIIPPTIADINEDGFDDDAFMAGAQSGDTNLDGILDVIDLVIFVETILNGE